MQNVGVLMEWIWMEEMKNVKERKSLQNWHLKSLNIKLKGHKLRKRNWTILIYQRQTEEYENMKTYEDVIRKEKKTTNDVGKVMKGDKCVKVHQMRLIR